MEQGERLSAYLAGELDADERSALDAELARDPALRADLQRLRRVVAMLEALPQPEPQAGFSASLQRTLAEELAAIPEDELAARRANRPSARALRPLAIAAAAAAVLAVIGVGAGVLLGRGPDASGGVTESRDNAAQLPGAQVVVLATDNDYNETDVERLAVGADLSEVRAGAADGDDDELAAELADQILLYSGEDQGGTTGAGEVEAPMSVTSATEEATAAGRLAAVLGPDAADDVSRCLPTILEGVTTPLLLVSIEVAAFQGEPAILYLFASLNPATDEYDRSEVWVVSRDDDCTILHFAQHDQG